MNKSFKGLLDSGDIERIRLSTNNGLTGYKIIKFDIYPRNMNVSDEYTVQVFSELPSAASSITNFDNPLLLATAFIETVSGAAEGMQSTVVFDTVKFNQDIYVTCDAQASNKCNYYIELEQVKLDLNEATVATLKDMRGRE